MSSFLLSIDQGTTSTRALVLDQRAQLVSSHQLELKQYFPRLGWVEHDGEEIWNATLTCCHEALKQAGLSAGDVRAIGITNQRETTIVWNRHTGKPIHRAIVWQDRRTAELCQDLKEAGHEAWVQEKTGLLLDPYFSATKLAWLLEYVPSAREDAERGDLLFGTIDSFLLWKLTGGQRHATDATNAARTLLFNIHTQEWDPDLLNLFKVNSNLLPEVLNNCDDFGKTEVSLFGRAIPIAAMAGDQHAALVGQVCFTPGMLKCTFGTGAFLVLNVGEHARVSKHRLLTTVGYRLEGQVTYALEGSIFAAGTIIQWLRDQLGFIRHASETEALATTVQDNGGVYLVPAFTGLGAPHWRPDLRGAILGLTRDSKAAHIVRAGLEAIVYQTRDLLDAMAADAKLSLQELRVDGGLVVNNWFLQFLADILHQPIARPEITETTALGVAFLAGLQTGLFASLDEVKKLWQEEARFTAKMLQAQRTVLYEGWQRALRQICAVE